MAQWQWAVQADGVPNFFGNYGTAVCALPDGNFAFAATINRSNSFGLANFENEQTGKVFIGVYSPIGTLQYVKRLPYSSTSYYEELACKNIAYNNNGMLFTAIEWYVYKFSPSGDYERIIENNSNYLSALSICGDTLCCAGIHYSYNDSINELHYTTSKYSYSLSLLRYLTDGTFLGGTEFRNVTGSCKISAITVLTDGNVAVSGYLEGKIAKDSLRIGDSSFNYKSSPEAFIVGLDSKGKHRWTVFISGPGNEEISVLATASNGGVFAAGSFDEIAYIGNITLRSRGGRDCFLLHVNSFGEVTFLETLGSPLTDDRCEGAAVDKSGHLWLTGKSGDSTILKNRCIRSNGAANAFIFSFDPIGEPLTAMMLGGTTLAEGRGIACGFSNVVITGYFSGRMEVGTKVLDSQSPNIFDFFIASLDPMMAKPITEWPMVPSQIEVRRSILVAKNFSNSRYSAFDLLGRKIQAVETYKGATGIIISNRGGNNQGRKSCFFVSIT